MRRPDPPSAVGGAALALLGGLLLLDQSGALELTFGLLAPAVCAAAGAILLALGLSRRA